MKVLLIGHAPILPANAGNRVRTRAIIDKLESRGDEVHFCHVNAESGDTQAMRSLLGDRFHHFDYAFSRTPARYRRLWNDVEPLKFLRRVTRRLGFPKPDLKYLCRGRGVDDWYDPELTGFLKDLQQTHGFDVVVVSYIFQSKAFDAFPQRALRVLDTVEKFTGRWRYTEHYCTNRDEQKALRRADRVIAIQEKEAVHFRRLIPKQNVFVVGHSVDLVDLEACAENSKKVLFMGSDNAANVDGIGFFIREIWPVIVGQMAEAELVIAGDVGAMVSESANVTKLGRVADKWSALKDAAVVICPLRFGTGLKIKVAEALSAGKAVVATGVGAEGLETGWDRALMVANNPHTFANHVTRLLEDVDHRRTLEREARRFASELSHQNDEGFDAAFAPMPSLEKRTVLSHTV